MEEIARIVVSKDGRLIIGRPFPNSTLEKGSVYSLKVFDGELFIVKIGESVLNDRTRVGVS